jgi:transcriptional regulator with XRE-family HTH domain
MTTAINFKTNPGQLERAHSARYALPKERPTFYKRAGLPKKSNLELPQQVYDLFRVLNTKEDREQRNDYIIALVKAGWSQASVARASGLSAQMIRVIMTSHQPNPAPATLLVPDVPRHAEKVGTSRYVMPTPELLERLKELQPYAQQVRSNSPRYRAEAEEYTYLLNQAHKEQGVTLYRLAKLLDVTTSAIAFRLVRYGYRTTEHGKSPAYRSITESNRKPK